MQPFISMGRRHVLSEARFYSVSRCPTSARQWVKVLRSRLREWPAALMRLSPPRTIPVLDMETRRHPLHCLDDNVVKIPKASTALSDNSNERVTDSLASEYGAAAHAPH